MFSLKKLHAPFGTADMPQWEPSYSEGLIPVVDGICEVRRPETRDRLLKLGYVDVEPAMAAKGEKMTPRTKPKPKGK